MISTWIKKKKIRKTKQRFFSFESNTILDSIYVCTTRKFEKARTRIQCLEIKLELNLLTRLYSIKYLYLEGVLWPRQLPRKIFRANRHFVNEIVTIMKKNPLKYDSVVDLYLQHCFNISNNAVFLCIDVQYHYKMFSQYFIYKFSPNLFA